MNFYQTLLPRGPQTPPSARGYVRGTEQFHWHVCRLRCTREDNRRPVSSSRMFWKHAVPGTSKIPFTHGKNCWWDTPGPASFKRQAPDGHLYSWSEKKVKAFPVLVHMRACHLFRSTSISPRFVTQKQPKTAWLELLVRSVKEARNTSSLPFFFFFEAGH